VRASSVGHGLLDALISIGGNKSFSTPKFWMAILHAAVNSLSTLQVLMEYIFTVFRVDQLT
jgi:hypothetical protein